jgi:hypothetical protein
VPKPDVQTLAIEAASRDSALDFYEALSAFDVQLWAAEEGTCRVEVSLGESEREITDVLNAIERYVTERHAGAARIKLNGRNYTLHEAPPLVGDL